MIQRKILCWLYVNFLSATQANITISDMVVAEKETTTDTKWPILRATIICTLICQTHNSSKAKLVLGNPPPFQFINDNMLHGLDQTILLLGFK